MFRGFMGQIWTFSRFFGAFLYNKSFRLKNKSDLHDLFLNHDNIMF